MYDFSGKIWNVQFIVSGEPKTNWPGGRVKGLFGDIRASNDKTDLIYIAEGFATAASVGLVSGERALCSFGVSNLESVLRGALERWGANKIRLVVDWDAGTLIKKGFNPGLKTCVELVKKYRVAMCFPFDRGKAWPRGRNIDASDSFIEDLGGLKLGLENPIEWGEL